MSNCWDTAGPRGRAPVGAAGREMTWTVRVMDPQSIEVSSEQFRHFEKRVTLLWNLQVGEHFICHFLSQALSVSPNYPSWQPAADSVITSGLLINFHPGIWWRFGTAFRYSYWHARALNKVKVRLRLHHTIKIKIVQFQFHHRYLMSFSKRLTQKFCDVGLTHNHSHFPAGASQFLSFRICDSDVWLSQCSYWSPQGRSSSLSVVLRDRAWRGGCSKETEISYASRVPQRVDRGHGLSNTIC